MAFMGIDLFICVTIPNTMYIGFRISTLDEKRGRTFDCGVQGQFTQDSRSSRRDRNLRRGIVPHYGKIEEIIVISYDAHTKFEEYVFKCKWFRSNLVGRDATVLQDQCGHTRLKTTMLVWLISFVLIGGLAQ